MIHTKFNGLAGAAALALAAQAFAAPAAAEELSFAHFVPPGHTLTRAVIEPFAEGIEAESDLTVRVYPGGELGAGPLEQYVRVVQGVADIAWGLQGYTSSQFGKTMIAELPGVFDLDEPGYPGIWAAMDQIQSEYPATKPLAVWTSEPNVFIMKGEENQVRTPDDVKGKKLRVSGSAAAALIEALGATPVQMPANEMYNALQTGLIDGIVTGASAISDFKLDEVADSYTIGAPLGRITFFVVMNQSRYDGLSDDQKAAIDKHSGEWLSQKAEEGWNAYADETVTRLSEAGNETVIELTEDEAAAFGALTLPVTEKIVADLGGEEVLSTMKGD